MFSFPGKDYNPKYDTSNVCWESKSTSFPSSKDSGRESLLKNAGLEAPAGKRACSEKASRHERGQPRWGWRGGEAVASGMTDLGDQHSVSICGVLGSAKGTNKNKISQFPKVHVSTSAARCLRGTPANRDQEGNSQGLPWKPSSVPGHNPLSVAWGGTSRIQPTLFEELSGCSCSPGFLGEETKAMGNLDPELKALLG